MSKKSTKNIFNGMSFTKFINSDDYKVTDFLGKTFIKNNYLPDYPYYRLIEISQDSTISQLYSNDLALLLNVADQSALISSIFVKRFLTVNFKLLKVIHYGNN